MTRQITTAYVPGVYLGQLQEQHRVEGDAPYATYPTREAAEQRAIELDDAETDRH